MAGKIRQSHYRHIYGEPFQLRDTYGDIRVGSIHVESTVLKSSGKFLAVPWTTTGGICVIPISQVGQVAEDTPLIFHTDEFGDPLQFNEFNFSPVADDIIASAGNDGKVNVFKIPEGGLTENIQNPLTRLNASDKRLLSLEWHNISANVLLTGSADKEVKFFDVEAQQEQLTLPNVHGGLLTGFSWNSVGNQLISCCKDKVTRIFDPRGNELIGEIPNDHEGTKSIHPIWMYYGDFIVTAGFSKGNDREIHAYDPRNLSTRIGNSKMDGGSSGVMLFQDEDLGLLFAGGKGDSTIKFFELSGTADVVQPLGSYRSQTPQNGLSLLPKTFCDVMSCEILRFVKLSGSRIEPIRVMVPRAVKNTFYEDLFPPTFDRNPVTTSAQWFAGEDGIRGRLPLHP